MRLAFSFEYDPTGQVEATYSPVEDKFIVKLLKGDKVLPELRKRLSSLAQGVSDDALCTVVPLTLYAEDGQLNDGHRVRIYTKTPLPDGNMVYIWLDTIQQMKLFA